MATVILQRELETYAGHQQELVGAAEGKYVLIRGDEVCGVWDTYDDALKMGYERFGLQPFLVKQIEAIERVHTFSREIGQPCRE